MNKTYQVLEFDKILDQLASYTESETVSDRIRSLEPYTTLSDAQHAQKETTEAVSALLRLGSPPVSLGIPNVTAAIKRCEIGGVLNPKDLLDVSRVLYVARRMKSYLSEAGEDAEILHAAGDSLLTAKALEDQINRSILSETEIADEASSDLGTIRRKIRNLNGKIKDSLNSMIHSPHYKKYLQDALVTMRSDRYVIPVRSEYRGEVPGIVHDTSASGATLFIEPMSVVNTNNEIRDLTNREQQEIERILAALSAAVSEDGRVISADFSVLSDLDFIFCKGRLSIAQNGNEPDLNGRHCGI